MSRNLRANASDRTKEVAVICPRTYGELLRVIVFNGVVVARFHLNSLLTY